jgi:mRNA (guanine-N7-)-methyltransferase
MNFLSQDLVKLDINDLLNCLNEQPVKIKNDFFKFVKDKVTERRQSSSIIAMRDFHNWIKRTMITNVKNLFKNKVNLLDIAVGRGGDIDKWNKAGISCVFGFDSNRESIESVDPFNPGARYRIQSYQALTTKIQVEIGDAIRPTVELLNKIDSFLLSNKLSGFDIVSCQFAMHYFFKCEQDLNITLSMVERYLVKGGYFIGTILDPVKIRSFFKHRTSKEYESQLFKIKIKKYFKLEPYGNEYSFEIKDTQDEGNYFNTTGVSTEYLVELNELVRVADIHKLKPVNKNMFESYILNKKIEYSNNGPFVSFESLLRFWNPKPGTRHITPGELELNNLYTTFIFQKV